MSDPRPDNLPSAPRPRLDSLLVVRETFGLFFGRFGQIFLPAFLTGLVLSVLNLGMTQPATSGGEPFQFAVFPDLVLSFVSLFLSFFVIGYLCLVSLDAAMGLSHGFGDYCRQVLRRLAPIGVLGLVVSVVSALGLFALVLPGLYLFARFLPWVEATVFEDRGWAGLARAQDLTEGYRWPLVGALLIMVLLAVGLVVILMLALAPLVGALTEVPALLSLLDAFMTGLSYSFGAVFTAVVYLRLRLLKEGKSIAEIAATIR